MFCKEFWKSMEFINDIGKAGKYCDQRIDVFVADRIQPSCPQYRVPTFV